MNSFRQVFPKPHTLLLAVHAQDRHQVLRNVRKARAAKADGVFLINHNIPADWLLEFYERAKEACPHFWIGLNFLGINPGKAFQMVPKDCDGLWLDNAGISESEDVPDKEAARLAEIRQQVGFTGLYFGGVAFKYQEQVFDPENAARLAKQHVDIITTSGPGTGEAADVPKIAAIRRGAGKHPVALASGVTRENVALYKPYVDGLIVATGVSQSFYELDEERIVALEQTLNA